MVETTNSSREITVPSHSVAKTLNLGGGFSKSAYNNVNGRARLNNICECLKGLHSIIAMSNAGASGTNDSREREDFFMRTPNVCHQVPEGRVF